MGPPALGTPLPMNLHFDCNATTAASEEVVEAMLPWLSRPGANPSATHPAGREAARAVQRAREQVAALIGARRAADVVFTSCGSESTATAFHAARHRADGAERPQRAIISTAEHSATKKAAAARFGDAVTTVPVDAGGALDRDALRAELAAGDVAIVSVILLNNETGVISDLDGLGEECRAAGALLHVDAVQAPAKTPIDVERIGCDLLGLSGHKFHGPRGVGVLHVSGGTDLPALIVGGPQEGERRAGTENVPGIVGFGVAAERAAERATCAEAHAEISARRDRLERLILDGCPGSSVNGDPARRAANTTNIGFDLGGTGLDATALLALLHDQGIEVSAGSACNSSRMAPSAVLLAMGQNEARAASALRLSLAHQGTPDATSLADVERCAAAVIEAHAQVQALVQ